MVDKSVLLNEVLYFVASVPDSGMTSKVRDAYISEAAREPVLSSTIPVSLMDSITTEQKTDILNTLNARGA